MSAQRRRPVLELERLLHHGRRPCLPGQCRIYPRDGRLALCDQTLDGGIICCNLRLYPRTIFAWCGCGPAQQLDPISGCDNVGMRVAKLRKCRGKIGFSSRKRAVALGRPLALQQQLPILVLKRGNLGREAPGIDHRRSAVTRQSGAISSLDRRYLAFELRDLGLKLIRLILQKANGQARLSLDIGRVHAEKFCDKPLEDGLSLARIGIIERHADRDRLVLATRLLTDITRECADHGRAAHLLDNLRHRLRPPLVIVEIILFDDRNQFTAAKNLLPDTRNTLVDRARNRRINNRCRKILRFDHQRRTGPIYRRQQKRRRRTGNQQSNEGNDNVEPTLPQDRWKVVDHP